MDGKRLPPFGARAGLRRAPEASTPAPVPGSPALLSVRPAPHPSPVLARDVGIWGSGMSGHSAPEKETVAPLPQNPSQGGGSAPGLPHSRSQAGGDALAVRVGTGGAEPVQARQPCPHLSPQPCPLARSVLRAPKKRVSDEGKLPTFAGVFKG